MIIQIAFCCISFKDGGKYSMDQFFGSCFSIAAGNGNKRYSKLLAVIFG